MSMGAGTYLVIVDGKICRYTHWDDIPDAFENIVSFRPDIPPSPHTREQHREIERIPEIFKQFMERERACGNKNR